MIKLVAQKCPACGATLSIDEGQKQVCCSQCGAKLSVNNENEYIIRHIDEAKLRELDEKAKEKQEAHNQAEIAQVKREQYKAAKKMKIIFVTIAAVVFIIIGIIGCLSSKQELFLLIVLGVAIAWIGRYCIRVSEAKSEGRIKFDYSWTDKNCLLLKTELEQSGFTNVQMLNLKDLKVGLLTKANSIESVIVSGKAAKKGMWYDPNASITISYHGFPWR